LGKEVAEQRDGAPKVNVNDGQNILKHPAIWLAGKAQITENS
jgi:hypothetical protein